MYSLFSRYEQIGLSRKLHIHTGRKDYVIPSSKGLWLHCLSDCTVSDWERGLRDVSMLNGCMYSRIVILILKAQRSFYRYWIAQFEEGRPIVGARSWQEMASVINFLFIINKTYSCSIQSNQVITRIALKNMSSKSKGTLDDSEK